MKTRHSLSFNCCRQFPTPARVRTAWRRAIQPLVLASLAALPGAGCGAFGPSIIGSGIPVTKEYEWKGFTRLAVSSAFQLDVTQSSQYSVAVTVDDNLVEYLDVTQSGETLRIKMQPNLGLSRATLKARVTMPELTALDLSGAVGGTVTGFSSDKPLEVELSGAASLRGDIKNGDARFDVSGASRVELRGSASQLNVTASGASRANLEEYHSGDTSVNASGASHINVTASGTLDADASGASSVRYGGEPSNVKAQSSGASSVRRK